MKVPSPGESITEVEIAQWLVSDGDFVDDVSGSLPGWANNEIFILNGNTVANNTIGCSELDACNYD